MGGNAIENACRITKQEHDELLKRLIDRINSIDSAFHPHVIPYFKSKQDFGDIDLLISSSSSSNSQEIADSFHATERYKNGNVLSFGINLTEQRVFQIDLISVPYIDLKIAQFYFSYNDLNLLTGRIAHKLGLKFGFDGLVLKTRTESGHAGLDIDLTKDPRRIYEFLGYSYDRYLQGFDTLEQVYQFIVSSKYFNPEIFQYEELNHINKTRNRKRSTYAGFLEWLTQQSDLPRYQYQQKSAYLIKTHCAFPEVEIFKQLHEYSENFRQQCLLKDKFNGHLVMQWTGLKGKELGVIMSEFERHVAESNDAKDFNQALESFSSQEIQELFVDWFEERK